MPTAPAAETDSPFESQIFWDLHKGKIALYGGLFVLALIVFSTYQCTARKRTADASALLAHATAAADYQQVISKYPGTIAAGNAHLLLGKVQREEKKYDEAIATLRQFNEKFAEHPLISSGWLSLAETLMAAGRADEAVQAYQQVTAKFSDTYSAPIAAIEQANLLRSQGKTEEAKRAYENVIAQFPRSYFQQEAMRAMRLLRK